MSNKIQVRRGTDAERLTKVFDFGEPVYTTDTKKLYIGDGVTAGGVEVSGLNSADVGSLIAAQADPTGAASSAVSAHESAVDPHPTYTTTAEAAAAAPVQSVVGRTGAVTLAVADVSGAAPLANPALTGTPTAPTAAAGTSTTQIATTAFAKSEAESAAVAMALVLG